jgi:hypothetical protein
MDDQCFEYLMRLTFPFQRVLINAKATMADLQNEWPILCTTRGLFMHFFLLMEIDLQKQLSKSLEEKPQPILNFFETGASSIFIEKEETDCNGLAIYSSGNQNMQ